MKIIVTEVKVIDFDIEQERERINRCEFSDDMRARLHKVCDLFEQSEFDECLQFVRTWGRDPELECPEVEFLGLEIANALQALCNGCTVEIRKPKPKCGNDGSSWQRMDCEYDEAGICIHCGEEIPF